MARLFWTQKQDMGPTARASHAMAYDGARQRVLLFGGNISSGANGDTWEWNGEYWTQVEDIGPRPRGSHAVAYDAAREQVILFGGNVPSAPGGLLANGETWAWDGVAWTQVADTGPSPRADHCMAYDSTRERVVLFGGQQPDTWEWDGIQWTQVADGGPPVRLSAAMTYDNVRERIVLFGGEGGGAVVLNDTWEFDGLTWTRLADTGPIARIFTAMVFSGARSILFGGEPGAPPILRDTWEWSGKFWTQRQDIGPSARFRHSMAYDSSRDRVVLFGGGTINNNVDGPPLSDTWELPGSLVTLRTLIFGAPQDSNIVATVSLNVPSPIGGINILVTVEPIGLVEIPKSVRVAEGKTSEQFL